MTTRRPSRALFPAAAALCLLAAACSNRNATLGRLPSIVQQPGAMVSLSLDVQPIFTLNCAVSGCHDAASHQQELQLDSAANSYLNLVNIPCAEDPPLVRVQPLNSSASFLMYKLLGTFGTRMPLNGAALPNSEIQLIRDWIDQGAVNN